MLNTEKIAEVEKRIEVTQKASDHAIKNMQRLEVLKLDVKDFNARVQQIDSNKDLADKSFDSLKINV